MAPFDAGLPTAGARFGRIAFGSICGLVSAMEAGGGREHLLVAGFFAATALLLLRPAQGRIRQGVDFAIDFTAIGALAFLCDPAGVLWRAPDTLSGLFTLTPNGASSAVGLYLLGVAILPGSRFALRGALFLLPFLFCLLVALGSRAIGELGGLLFLGLEAPQTARVIAARTLILFLLNEAVIVGAPLALGRYLPQQWRPHGVLFVAALIAAVTPEIASLGAHPHVAFLPAPIAIVLASLLAAAAQAGTLGRDLPRHSGDGRNAARDALAAGHRAQ